MKRSDDVIEKGEEALDGREKEEETVRDQAPKAAMERRINFLKRKAEAQMSKHMKKTVKAALSKIG